MLKRINFRIDYKGRKFGLDLLRALAIILVLLSHSKTILSPISDHLSFLGIGGFYGVELFFVLSGFLIGSIFIKSYLKGHFGVTDMFHFWKRRWFRTMPNYYLILFFNIILTFFLKGTWDFFNWKFFFFSQNLFENHPKFFSEAWSLSVEEWFYLLLPTTVFVLGFFIQYFGLEKRRILFLIIVFLLVIITANRLLMNYIFDLTELENRKMVIFRLDAILYGVFVAYLNYYSLDKVKKYRNLLFYIGVLILAFCTVLYYVDLNGNNPSYFSKTLLYSLLSISFSCFIPWADNLEFRQQHIIKVVTHISLISYSMYLIHSSVILKIQRYLFRPESYIESLVIYCGFWGATILGSTLLYLFYEKPFTELRDRIKQSKPVPIINETI